MSYRNKTYVAFDGDNDIKYYWLMRAWKKLMDQHLIFMMLMISIQREILAKKNLLKSN